MKKKQQANPNRVEIYGVGIELDSKDISSAKNVDDLKKLEIFSHLREPQQNDAYNQLGKKLKESNAEFEIDEEVFDEHNSNEQVTPPPPEKEEEE